MDNIQKIKGFNVQEFMIAIIVCFAVLSLIIMATAQISSNYGVQLLDPSINSTTSKFNDLANATNAMYGNVSSGDSFELSSTTSVFAFTKAATRVLGIFFVLPLLLTDFLKIALTQIGLAPQVANLVMNIIMTVCIVMIVFAIIRFLTRSNV